MLISKFAELLNISENQDKYSSLADAIRTEFNRKFYRGNGIYANSEMTSLAAALYFDLAEDTEKTLIAEQLNKLVEANDYKADFGILGAKYIPRVLADYGYIDSAFKLITQTEFPGWGYWIKQGATKLWEKWDEADSQNHIMFGDFSAWAYQYLGGIIPNEKFPGFKNCTIKPLFPAELEYFSASHKSPNGTIVSTWRRINDSEVKLELSIPETITANLQLPKFYQLQKQQLQDSYKIPAGKSNWEINFTNKTV